MAGKGGSSGGGDGFVSVLLAILMVAELCAFIICVLLGELREFLSLELQAFTLAASLAITAAKIVEVLIGAAGARSLSTCRLPLSPFSAVRW